MACKKVITKCWYKTESPSINQWIDKVKEMCLMEKMTLSLRSSGATFHRKWEIWTAFIRSIEDDTH